MKKSKLIHIGFPKCMSTSLQRDFFAKNNEIYFLGNGIQENDHGWIDNDTASLFEVGIRYEPEMTFNKNDSCEIIKRHMDTFEQMPEKTLFCMSSESMSFTMNFDIDAVLKAQRLHQLFGNECKVLIVIRNQFDLFRSYYYECVRGGYAGIFGEFLEFNYYYQFHSILYDMFFENIYELYSKLFGKDHVFIIPMESIIENPEDFQLKLCQFAEITPCFLELHRNNDSNDKSYLHAVLLLNSRFRNNMGSSYFSMVDPEKILPYWQTALKEKSMPISAQKCFSDRMMIYRSANAVVRDFVEDLPAEYSEFWKNKFIELFSKHNTKLSKIIGIDLSSFGYPLE